MLEEIFKKLDVYRSDVTDYVDSEIFDEKQNELNVELPLSMIEFYRHFGNDEEVMMSFDDFGTAEDITILYNALVFGEKYQSIGLLGIQLNELEHEHQVVSWYPYDVDEWVVESANEEIFFLGRASWQILNTLPSVARVGMKLDAFVKIVGEELQYLSDKTLHQIGDIIPVIGEGILGCYFTYSEELYLGTKDGDDVLRKYEKSLGLDLDWI